MLSPRGGHCHGRSSVASGGTFRLVGPGATIWDKMRMCMAAPHRSQHVNGCYHRRPLPLPLPLPLPPRCRQQRAAAQCACPGCIGALLRTLPSSPRPTSTGADACARRAGRLGAGTTPLHRQPCQQPAGDLQRPSIAQPRGAQAGAGLWQRWLRCCSLGGSSVHCAQLIAAKYACQHAPSDARLPPPPPPPAAALHLCAAPRCRSLPASAAAAAAAAAMAGPIRIGVLALQGSFREHMTLLNRIPGVEAVEVGAAAAAAWRVLPCKALAADAGASPPPGVRCTATWAACTALQRRCRPVL